MAALIQTLGISISRSPHVRRKQARDVQVMRECTLSLLLCRIMLWSRRNAR